MSRREYYAAFKCAEEGCKEHTRYAYATRRDEAESLKWQAENPWKCARHVRPEQVVKLEDQVRSSVLVVEDRERLGRRFRYLDGKWHLSYVDLPGLRIFAEDFPSGTIVTLTVGVTLPPVL